MSNFSFLLADFPALHADAVEAEQLTLLSPKAAAIFCRSTLENAINWLYDHDPKLTRPFKSELSALMHEHCFASQFNQTMLGELHLIRKTGNVAAHGSKVSQQDALASLKYLYRFLRYVATYYGKQTPSPQAFDEHLIPTGAAKPESAEQIAALQQQLAAKDQAVREAEQVRQQQSEENAQLKAQLEQQQAELAARKQAREKTIDFEQAVPLLVSEAETRRRYIDLSLKECGWDNLQEGRELEFEVTGMPVSTNPTGKGYVDYVLWGDDGLPLAVIEAKKTMADARKGKHQAELYANCLKASTGQRPIIFYSNGFETHIWDDQFYPEREIAESYITELQQTTATLDKSRFVVRAKLRYVVEYSENALSVTINQRKVWVGMAASGMCLIWLALKPIMLRFSHCPNTSGRCVNWLFEQKRMRSFFRRYKSLGNSVSALPDKSRISRLSAKSKISAGNCVNCALNLSCLAP